MAQEKGLPRSRRSPVPELFGGIDAILRLPDVIRVTGLSKTSIYRMIAEGEFPRPVQLGKQAVGWKSSAIQQWNESREEVPLDAGPWAVRREPAADLRAASGRRTPGGRR